MAITLEPTVVDAKPVKASLLALVGPQPSSEQPISEAQSQSALLDLPAELRHKIYRFVLTDSEPFVDPFIPSSAGLTIRSPFHTIPFIGPGLLRTCRRIYVEATSLAYLFGENVFQFTTVTHCHKFLSLVGRERASQIRILSINLRLVAQGDAMIADEWLSYVSEEARGGLWTQRRLGSMRTDLPNVRCVRLDLSGWCRPGYGQHRWEYFRSILRELHGLECIAVGGEVKLRNLDLAVWEPWAPELFLTNNAIDRSQGMPYGGTMVDLMIPVIQGNAQKDRKWKDLKILWSIAHGKVTLELSTGNRAAKKLSAINLDHWKASWAESYQSCSGQLSSSCTWGEYEKQVNTYKAGLCSAKVPFPEVVVKNLNGYVSTSMPRSIQSG